MSAARPSWTQALCEVLELPRERRLDALRHLRARHPIAVDEEWNTTFDDESLYATWTTIQLLQGLYAHNRAAIRPLLDERTPWHIVEVGGGNGALWRDFLRPDEKGHFTLVDPEPSAHRVVEAALPSGVEFHSLLAPVEEAELPHADLVVCSLMLHHVAGRDTQEKQAHAFAGPGKCEILTRFIEAVRPQKGLCILNEADVYAEVDLPPADPLLIDNLIDSYVGRAGMALAAELDRPDLDPAQRQRLEIILLHWFVDQPERCGFAPLSARDVYELQVAQWLELLDRAGARVHSYRCTDAWRLFYQYLFSAA